MFLPAVLRFCQVEQEHLMCVKTQRPKLRTAHPKPRIISCGGLFRSARILTNHAHCYLCYLRQNSHTSSFMKQYIIYYRVCIVTEALYHSLPSSYLVTDALSHLLLMYASLLKHYVIHYSCMHRN